MRIAVWKTGHEIADAVADAVISDNNSRQRDCTWHLVHTNNFERMPRLAVESSDEFDIHIGYGILRGMGDIMKACERANKPFFHIDRGYLNPGHYEGYYRISYRGTQAKWHEGIPRKPIDIKMEPWKIPNRGTVVICPPTEAVCAFFKIAPQTWLNNAIKQANDAFLTPAIAIHHKSDNKPFDWEDCLAVITFNSSVGWQALQRGIPVLSDPVHSIVGSYYAYRGCDTLQKVTDFTQKMGDSRMELFEAMAAHQFTLQEIREGKAWPILNHYIMCGSDLILGKPLPPRSAPIPSVAAPNPTLTSSFSNIGN